MEDATFDFNELFVLDLANNHQGSADHGRTIIRSVAEVVAEHGVRAAIKFQFRQLDSFIHPDHQADSDLKYIQRFLSTRLERRDFERLLREVRAGGLLAACTPFDEESVPIAVAMGFDVLKVASCSAKDWPLLEEIADAGKPLICSTGGLTIEDIDNLVSFFEHRAVHFALMHCVSVYPTPDDRLNLRQIRTLRDRYSRVPIGWSTHENPDDTLPVQIAYAEGAQLFERHVGVETEEIRLNAYSSTPEQIGRWFAAYARAKRLCGSAERQPAAPDERASLDDLRRGVYARRPILKGSAINRDQVYFAMPYVDEQLDSGTWKEGISALENMAPDAPLRHKDVRLPAEPEVMVIKRVVHEAKAILNEARVALGTDFRVEYSHHDGIENFRTTGAIIIECINRDYCKKLIIQLAGQRHPAHYHGRKEETFQVLHGILQCNVDGQHYELHPGQSVLILPGVWHSFWTDTGVVFEEISTTHYVDDSFYEDKRINRMKPSERKTIVDHWGRFQIDPRRRPGKGSNAPSPPRP